MSADTEALQGWGHGRGCAKASEMGTWPRLRKSLRDGDMTAVALKPQKWGHDCGCAKASEMGDIASEMAPILGRGTEEVDGEKEMKEERPILILWDIDGTLLHCGGDGAKALDQAFLQLYGIPNAFAKARIGHAMDQALIEELMEDFSLESSQIPLVKEAYGKALREILRQNENKRVLPGIVPLMELMQKEPDIYNGILTSNLRLGAAIKLEVMGLASYFSFRDHNDLASEKWEEALREISDLEKLHGVTFPRNRVILIGDTAYDIQTAKLLQAKSIGVATGWASRETLMEAEPDYLFHDLSHPHEFLKVIRGLVHENI